MCLISERLVEMGSQQRNVFIQCILKCLFYILGVQVQAEPANISNTTRNLDSRHLVSRAEHQFPHT